MTTATPTASTGVPLDGAPGFGATLAGEWIKLRTSRGVRRNLLLGALLGIALSVLLAFIVGNTFDGWSTADVATFVPLETALAGQFFVAIFFLAAAVNFVATEYSSQMIRLTFAVTPRRPRVIAAKACVIAAATFVAGLVTTVLMLGVSQIVMGAYDVPHTGLGEWRFWETVLLVTVTIPVFPLLAVFITFILRSTAASLSTVLALLFIPSMFGGLFPKWWQENIIAAFPGPATDSINVGHLTTSDLYLPRGVAVVAVVAWIAVLYVVSRAYVNRRDA